MDRLGDYRRLGKVDDKYENTINKELFYDTIYNDILSINRKIKPTLTYKNILDIEQEMSKIVEDADLTLKSISLNSTEDELLHYDGIKAIIRDRIVDTKQRIYEMKTKKASYNNELNPEIPKNFINVSQVGVFEQENKEIVRNIVNERYKETVQRLLEIESLQDTIFDRLNMQNEGIDQIVDDTGRIHISIRDSKNIVDGTRGTSSFLRRFFIILMFSLTFTLFFLHFFYK